VLVYHVPVQTFDSLADEQPYLDWLRDNRRGFVLNTNQGKPARDDTRLHQATCDSITRLQSGREHFTGGDYRKLCSTDRRELESWVRTNGGFGVLACSRCLG